MKPITHLEPIDMAWLLALFEGATLFVMGLWVTLGLGTAVTGLANNILLGAATGLLGTVIALFLWRWRVRGRLDGKPFTLRKIGVRNAAIANAIFLIVLFIIEDLIRDVERFPGGTALLGFLAVGIALVILFFIYNRQPLKIKVTFDGSACITRISPVRAAILAGAYEAIILPTMAFLFVWLNLHPLLTYTLTGLVAGLVGGFVGTLVFNVIAPRLKPWIEIS